MDSDAVASSFDRTLLSHLIEPDQGQCQYGDYLGQVLSGDGPLRGQTAGGSDFFRRSIDLQGIRRRMLSSL
jgi:hypothetical protein